MTRTATFLLTAASALAAGSLANAQSFPERPISVVVGFGPGGGSDQMARAITAAISETSDIAFQVENKPGASGLVAAADVLSRPADGYTLLQQSDGVVSAVATGQLDAEFGTDIVPVCLTQSTFSQIYVRAGNSDLSTIQDVAALAGERRLTMANTYRPGTMEFILGRGLEAAIGGQIEQINFDKPGERYAALLGGQVDLLLEQPGDVAAYVEGGQFKPVLTLLADAPSAFPDVPALSEMGYDAIPPLERVRGIFADADIPDDRLAFLQEACIAGYQTESYQAFNEERYMDPDRSLRTGEAALAFLRQLQSSYEDANSQPVSQ